MFNKFKNLFGAKDAKPETVESDQRENTYKLSENDKLRFAEMIEYLGEPDGVYMDDPSEAHQVHVLCFGRNFVEECDDDKSDDEGYLLVTSGMSDYAMPRPAGSEKNDSSRKELIWYVREPEAEYVHWIRWLTKLPNFDQFFLSPCGRVPMPDPPLSGCDKKTFLFLQPIIDTDSRLLDDIEIGDEEIETLCVHMVSDAEHAFIKNEDGMDEFLDMLDANNYPYIFDPHRPSYV
jgi:hypothetical protein